MLMVRELGFSYHRREILRNISFDLLPGECLVVAGPNGKGKTTLLSLLAGVLKPKTGKIDAEGARIGLVPQGGGIFEDMTVQENLKFFCNLAGCSLPSELPYGLGPYAKKRAGTLSGGYQKRLGIACTMMSDPDIWLLDEPCAGLDILWRDEMLSFVQYLKDQGKSVVYVSHDPAEFCGIFDWLLFLGSENSLYHRSDIPYGQEEWLFRQWMDYAAREAATKERRSYGE